jgi:hypothetical protein
VHTWIKPLRANAHLDHVQPYPALLQQLACPGQKLAMLCLHHLSLTVPVTLRLEQETEFSLDGKATRTFYEMTARPNH